MSNPLAGRSTTLRSSAAGLPDPERPEAIFPRRATFFAPFLSSDLTPYRISGPIIGLSMMSSKIDVFQNRHLAYLPRDNI
jgi:hypothetical protein